MNSVIRCLLSLPSWYFGELFSTEGGSGVQAKTYGKEQKGEHLKASV